MEAAFQAALNSHGYGLQFAVLKAAKDAYNKGISRWELQVSEMPVAVQQQETRVDFILCQVHHTTYLLLAECKRANPKFVDWCFCRSPFVRRNDTGEALLLEHVALDSTNGVYTKLRPIYAGTRNSYHIAIEVKGRAKGDAQPPSASRGAIEEAAGQCMMSLNGMIEGCRGHPQRLKANGEITFLPVIFTTARLWVSDIDLGQANLATGELSEQAALKQVDWLYYQYHVSPGLKHKHRQARAARRRCHKFFEQSTSGQSSSYLRSRPPNSCRQLILKHGDANAA